MKRTSIALALVLQGCVATPPRPVVLTMPPSPVLSTEAKTDAKKAYIELIQHYKTLRDYAKQQQDALEKKSIPVQCSVKIGDLTLPIIGFGDIHLVIFSYCGSQS
jgi:hypothetical protein